MEIISANETLDFLSRSAPRAWVKRMLLWMIFSNEITAYFREAKSIAKTRVLKLLLDTARVVPTPETREALIRENFESKLAEKLIAANDFDEINEVAHQWERDAEPTPVSCGYFVHATDMDWEGGSIKSVIYYTDVNDDRLFSDSEDLLGSVFQDADFDITLNGWCFDREQIELLQPHIELPRRSEVALGDRPNLGRPRTWDWDSASAHLISIAQTPDGLPVGPGAQAQIERLVSDWFMSSAGNSPADSQIRKHVAKIIKAIKKPDSR